MDNKKIELYDFSDFILDEDFAKKVANPELAEGYLKSLKESFPEKKDEIELAVRVMRGIRQKTEMYSYRKKLELWDKITSVRSKRKQFYYLKGAAAALLLATLGSLTFYLFQEDNGMEKFAKQATPGNAQSKLILSDGSEVDISNDQQTVQYSTDGMSVGINDSVSINQDATTDVYNQLLVPFGRNINLVLADGTKVWLHSGSRLVYPPVFNYKSREVWLEGEGYFEVATNPEKPFYVKTDRMKVQVYGTRFNVRAYQDQNLFSALLLEGKVSMVAEKGLFRQEFMLSPNEQGMMEKEGNEVVIEEVEFPENHIAWINNHLNFNNEELENLLERVERFYNIQIELKTTMNTVKISGKLDLKDDPERVLKGIAIIARVRLSKKGENYVMYN